MKVVRMLPFHCHVSVVTRRRNVFEDFLINCKITVIWTRGLICILLTTSIYTNKSGKNFNSVNTISK